MAIDLSDDILQDFLIEAGEILEELGEQLIQLEASPKDSELLNAIFRGFHTIKGGAGFINITPLVELCHRAEDVFNALRQGDKDVTSSLMDVILKVHDVLNTMFDEIRQGIEPDDADKALLESLERLMDDDAETAAPETTAETNAEPEPGETVASESADKPTSNGDNDDITDDEFEALLDQLHGKSEEKDEAKPEPASSVEDSVVSKANDDEIDEEDFEKLLDQLHGNTSPGSTDINADSKDKSVKENKQEETAKASAAPAASAAPVAEKVKSDSAAKPEKIPGKQPAQQPAETTVRVDTSRLDDIMNLVGELVLVRNRLSTLEASTTDEAMSMAVSNLDLVTSDLQSAVMKTRMQPIKKVFGRFPRVVRDLSRSLNKEITLEMMGEDTDLDKNLVEALSDPLVHLVRNSIDHGIEMPDDREKSGKPRCGTVTLSATQEGDHILLRIEDDGAGMDAKLLQNIAIKKGVLDKEAASRLTPRESYNLIFMPGFSTKEEISDISGRGVGMDVVKTRITQLNGSIVIDSERGKGSIIEIKVPLTLAIMPTLMVMINNQIFALPLGSVVEIFHLDLSHTKVVDGQEVVIIRDKAMPIFHLKDWLIESGSQVDNKSGEGHVVVVSAAGKYIGFIVDKLLGQEEVVIKPLGALLHGTKGLAGATITGNGKISLILDVPGLMSSYAGRI